MLALLKQLDRMYLLTNTTEQNIMKALINLQGVIFRTEQAAKDYYGERYETAILEWVELDEDGEVI
jgi:hypothetical protein